MTKSKFRRLTGAQARRAWQWFAKHFGLSDWTITLQISDQPPRWAVTPSDEPGVCVSCRCYETAEIWVSNSRCEQFGDGKGLDPLQCLFHEFCHVLACKAGIDNDGDQPREFVWNRLEIVLAGAYRAKVKPI